jgi:hypothetical protein
VRDSCGSSVTGETPQSQGGEEAHRTPRGKRAAWSRNQLLWTFIKSNKVYENSLYFLLFDLSEGLAY